MPPTVAVANDLACKGLDRIEKTLPILQQPSEQVSPGSVTSELPLYPMASVLTSVPAQIVYSAKDVVTSAKEAVTGSVSGAKGAVSDTLSTAVERTRGAVQGGMEKTRAVVSISVNTVLESRMARLVSSGVDTALSTSENLVDQYLPVTDDELGEGVVFFLSTDVYCGVRIKNCVLLGPLVQIRFWIVVIWGRLSSCKSCRVGAASLNGFKPPATSETERCFSPRRRTRGQNCERLRRDRDQLLRPPGLPLHQAAQTGVQQSRGQDPGGQTTEHKIHG